MKELAVKTFLGALPIDGETTAEALSRKLKSDIEETLRLAEYARDEQGWVAIEYGASSGKAKLKATKKLVELRGIIDFLERTAGELEEEQPAKETKTNVGDLIMWAIINEKVDRKNIQEKFGLKEEEYNAVAETLAKKGIVDLVKEKGLLKEDTYMKVKPDAREVRSEIEKLSPAVTQEDHVKKYKTRIDAIVELVNRFGRVNAGGIAKYYKADKETIEKIGHILDKNDVIAVSYPVTGDVVLTKIQRR